MFVHSLYNCLLATAFKRLGIIFTTFKYVRNTDERIQLGIGLGMVEMRSIGVLHCVSECRVTVYCAFIGVSLSLLAVALLIVYMLNTYSLYLQALKTITFCICRHTEHVFLYL